uniref:Ig-like domain-containing protein n=1 Tax=Monopterus albus TaxID=43700 RepID=A0A3Q3Q5F5_MONAL
MTTSSFFHHCISQNTGQGQRSKCLFVISLQVIGENRVVVQGGTVTLPCKLIDTTEDITQISWQRKTRGKPQNDNFFTILPKNGPQFVNGKDDRFKFIGSIKDNNGTLQISDVTLLDEGVYTCIFTLFPSGNHKREILLDLIGNTLCITCNCIM